MSTTVNLEAPHDEEHAIADGNRRQSENTYNDKRVSRIQLERIPGAIITETSDELQAFWDRLKGKGRARVGVFKSIKNILLSSCKLPLGFRILLTDNRSTRAEYPPGDNTYCMGLSLRLSERPRIRWSWMGSRNNVHFTFPCTHTSRTITRLGR